MKLNINWNELVSRSQPPLNSPAALSLLLGSCSASWQLPGWLNYDTPRIMRGSEQGGESVGVAEERHMRNHSLSLFSLSQKEFARFSMWAYASPYPPSPTFFHSFSLSQTSCFSLSLSALWRKLVIMMRLIVAYFVVEVEVYTLRAQLVASLFPTLSLSVSDMAHSLGSPTNVCFLPLTPIGLNMQIHLRGHQSTKWIACTIIQST